MPSSSSSSGISEIIGEEGFMARVAYEIKWVEPGEGENGYFARLTKAEAEKIRAFLQKIQDAGHITDLEINKIEGYSFKDLMDEIKERAEGLDWLA